MRDFDGDTEIRVNSGATRPVRVELEPIPDIEVELGPGEYLSLVSAPNEKQRYPIVFNYYDATLDLGACDFLSGYKNGTESIDSLSFLERSDALGGPHGFSIIKDMRKRIVKIHNRSNHGEKEANFTIGCGECELIIRPNETMGIECKTIDPTSALVVELKGNEVSIGNATEFRCGTTRGFDVSKMELIPPF